MDVRALLKKHGIQPSKGLGQSFLIDERVYDRILQASDLQAEDVVLEIGPGLGSLTRCLADRVAQVVAVELDRKMIAVLSETVGNCANVHLIHADILETDPVQALGDALGRAEGTVGPYKVVANLPYYITSAVLRHLLSARLRPQRLTLMVQWEVAQRIVAPPGQMSLLAVSVQVFGEPRLVCRVPARAFYPAPKVDSAILTVATYPQPRADSDALPLFFRIVQAGFAQRRKQLHNSLRSGLALSGETVQRALDRAGIAATRRPQTLSVEEWVRLTDVLRIV